MKITKHMLEKWGIRDKGDNGLMALGAFMTRWPEKDYPDGIDSETVLDVLRMQAPTCWTDWLKENINKNSVDDIFEAKIWYHRENKYSDPKWFKRTNRVGHIAGKPILNIKSGLVSIADWTGTTPGYEILEELPEIRVGQQWQWSRGDPNVWIILGKNESINGWHWNIIGTLDRNAGWSTHNIYRDCILLMQKCPGCGMEVDVVEGHCPPKPTKIPDGYELDCCRAVNEQKDYWISPIYGTVCRPNGEDDGLLGFGGSPKEGGRRWIVKPAKKVTLELTEYEAGVLASIVGQTISPDENIRNALGKVYRAILNVKKTSKLGPNTNQECIEVVEL